MSLIERRSRLAATGPRSRRGTSLIEVLISVLILGIGLLGIAAMQATALRNNQSSLERTQATIQTYSVLDAMRANRARALAGDYDLARTCDTYTGTGNLAQRDLQRWFQAMTGSMGVGACASIVRNGQNVVVTVEWDDTRATDGGVDGADSDRNEVVTRVRL